MKRAKTIRCRAESCFTLGGVILRWPLIPPPPASPVHDLCLVQWIRCQWEDVGMIRDAVNELVVWSLPSFGCMARRQTTAAHPHSGHSVHEKRTKTPSSTQSREDLVSAPHSIYSSSPVQNLQTSLRASMTSHSGPSRCFFFGSWVRLLGTALALGYAQIAQSYVTISLRQGISTPTTARRRHHCMQV